MSKSPVTLYLADDLVNDFKKVKEILSQNGIKLTLSSVTEEALKKYIDVFEPVLEKVKNNEPINKAFVFDFISKLFSELSEEFKKINQE